MHSARHLDTSATAVARALRRRGREVWPLQRRGSDLGQAVTVHRDPPTERVALQRWAAAEPVFLPGVLADRLAGFDTPIRRSLRMFARLRQGASFLEEIGRRLADDSDLEYVGSSVDADDPREVERVFVDARPGGVTVAEDLWARLAWIASGEGDSSLRIRFSAGVDQMDEWMTTSDRTASWVDQFALRAFPECRAVLACAPLRRRLDQLLARPYRLSERIVYNNAPGGGAVFHHDAEPGQLGVVFSQLEGRTAWLTLGKRRLAGLLVRTHTCRNLRRAMQALDAQSDPELIHLINRDPAFTALLAAHGALFVLRAGDAILLPSHGIDEVAWHSVIALDRRPSLAHSYGVFARQSDYEAEADPWRAMPACDGDGD